MPEPDTTTTPTTETPSPTPTPTAEPWRAGQHSRFAGKTPEEILGIAEGLAIVAERFNQPVPQPQVQHNAFDLDQALPDGEYADNAKVKDVIRRLASQGQTGDPVARQLAAQGLLSSVQVQRSEDFKRWGPEINGELAKLPMEYWTLEHLNTVVNIVRSRHIDELAAEKAQRLLDESHPTIRSGTGGLGSVSRTQPTLGQEGLSKEWVAKLQKQGIDEAKVAEFCRDQGITVEQYYADAMKAAKGPVIFG